MTSALYKTSPIRRQRRTKAEMAWLRAGLYRIIRADQPMTVRQVFYQAVVAGLIEKTEGEYQNTVARLLLDMRRGGEIPYRWISNNTRWMRRPAMYKGLAEFVARHQRAPIAEIYGPKPIPTLRFGARRKRLQASCTKSPKSTGCRSWYPAASPRRAISTRQPMRSL
jgi:hypothetical protein